MLQLVDAIRLFPVAGTQLGYRLEASYSRSDSWGDRGDNRSLALSGALRLAPAERLTVTLRGDFGDVSPRRYWGTPLLDGRLGLRKRRARLHGFFCSFDPDDMIRLRRRMIRDMHDRIGPQHTDWPGAGAAAYSPG